MSPVRVVSAQAQDLDRYLNLLESVANWLASRGIEQWRTGNFERSRPYYADSIQRGEVYLALSGGLLAGTVRMLPADPLTWPDASGDDALYLHTMAISRDFAGQQLGARLIEWAGDRAMAVKRPLVRTDCLAASAFLQRYYLQAGFRECGEIDARFPEPVGDLRLRRFEKRV